MNFSAPKKDQNTQYAVIGGILLFVVGLFISYPSLTNSAADDYARGRKSKSSVNLKSWNSVYEGLAPGQAIGAESSSDTAVSHLYVLSDSDAQMFQYDDAASSSTESGSAGTAGSAGGAGSAAGGGSASNRGDGGSLASALKAKLQSMSGGGLSGLGGSGGGSSSGSGGKTPSLSGTGSGGGSGSAAGGKGGSLVALERSSQLSADAATKKNEGAAAAAASAFGDFQSEGVKLGGNIETADSALINSDFVVKDVKGAELEGDVKDIKYASPEASSVSADTSSASGDDMKKQIMMMIIQVAITSIMGPVFGGISSALMSGMGMPNQTQTDSMETEAPRLYCVYFA